MQVFMTGGTGYLGSRLIPLLAAKGHDIHALVRPGSERRLPAGCTPLTGDALDRRSFMSRVPTGATFVQLVGVAHPSPAKAAEFQTIDLASIRESVAAATSARVGHFVYVSVAHPSPVMKAYGEVRRQGEAMIRASGLNATILRPFYVLGPGHRWPYALVPAYALFERLPWTRDRARRLGLVTLAQMLRVMVQSVENPAEGVRALNVPDIRAGVMPASEVLQRGPA